jgi:hypothetical protein
MGILLATCFLIPGRCTANAGSADLLPAVRSAPGGLYVFEIPSLGAIVGAVPGLISQRRRPRQRATPLPLQTSLPPRS